MHRLAEQSKALLFVSAELGARTGFDGRSIFV